MCAHDHEQCETEGPKSDLLKYETTENSIVCFCYRLTTAQLKRAYSELGSLKEVERVTRAGTGCCGCKVILNSLFNEEVSDPNNLNTTPTIGSSCVKPGQRTMKGFIVADGTLESRVCSSNAVAPQLGDCDSTTSASYALVDHEGKLVLERQVTLRTNETFSFDTRNENLPRPFYGMFLLTFERSNYGASRFNIYWSNGTSTASTHENASTGRLRVFIPILVDQRFIDGDSSIFLALMNPHGTALPFQLAAYNPDTGDEVCWESSLAPHGSTWIDATKDLYSAALKKFPKGKFVLRIVTCSGDFYSAITAYFFIYNKKTNSWTSNHL